MSSEAFRNAVLEYWAKLAEANETGSQIRETHRFVLWFVDNARTGLPLVNLYTAVSKAFRILLDAKVTATTGNEQMIKAIVDELIKAGKIIVKEETISIVGAKPFKGAVLYPNNIKH